MVTTVDVYKAIRRLQLDGVTSQREAARLLGISRNTVKKYWKGGAVPWERQEYERAASVLTSEVQHFIEECFQEDEREHARKQHHTARRIYNRLVEECGFKGSESSIRKAVQKIKTERGSITTYVPLQFSPGTAIQVDWGEATVYLNDERITINLFCARLCYSCAPIVFAYRRQNLESFLDALIRTFQYYGGTPKRIIFDNARVAVKDGFGAHAVAQDDYAQLAAHYGFEAVFCNPASGNEKGLVENLVGYIRRNVCVPLPRVKNLEELNGKLLEKCVGYLGHKIEGRSMSVGEAFETDRQNLQTLPHHLIDISKKYYPTVGRYSTVVVETNKYSVPCGYRGQKATVKAYPNDIEIWINGNLAATHNRLFGRKEESLDLRHYLPILSQKGRAIRFAKPVQNHVPASFIDWMENQELTSQEMVEMLEACLDVGYQAVMMRDPIPKQTDIIPIDQVKVQSVDLSQYDKLAARGAAQ